MPSAATFTVEAIFGLSGFFNVILLLTTRPESGLFGQLMFVSPARLTPADSRFRREQVEFRLGRMPSESSVKYES